MITIKRIEMRQKITGIIQITIRFFLLFLFIPAVSQSQVTLNQQDCYIDSTHNIILSNRLPQPIDLHNSTVAIGSLAFTLTTAATTFEPGTGYQLRSNTDNKIFTIYFTQLPIVNIQVVPNVTIPTNTYVSATFQLQDTSLLTDNYSTGIEIHGATSAGYPKKSYNLKFRDDEGEDLDASFLGMRSDNKWILLAMWDETLRLSNVVSENLWRKIDTLYYTAKEPDAQTGIRLQYVEVFKNYQYQGVYALAEDMDRKELKLKKEKDGVTKGELYKGNSWGGPATRTGAITFDGALPALPGANSTLWGGWELDYPDNTDWVNLRNYTGFVESSSDNDFKAGIFDRVARKNLVNYFLFANVLYANDNYGKNTFLAKYDAGEPYFTAPWDLNATWGYNWDQSLLPYNKMINNGLYERLWSLDVDHYKRDVADRWFALRKTSFDKDSLLNDLETQYHYLLGNGVYEREGKIWNNSGWHYKASELDYMETWMTNRLGYLDQYFEPYRTVALPIVLSDFGVTAENHNVLIQWVASTENHSSFDVQRSTDGISFITISTISGNSSVSHAYSFVDKFPPGGILFYRLALNDYDGSHTYSDIKPVDVRNRTTITCYPNPATDYIHFMAGANSEEVFIFDAKGTVVIKASVSGSAAVNIKKLPAGMYYGRTGSHTFSFIKK